MREILFNKFNFNKDNKNKMNLKFLLKKKIKLVVLIFLILLLFFIDNSISAQKKLINKLIVAIDHNYPPYVFRGEDNILRGYLVDLWKEWEKVTGTSVFLYAVAWSEALNAIQNGKAELIDTIFFTEERSKIFSFSKPYENIKVPIFFHRSISGLTDYQSLKGFLIAAKEGDAVLEYLRKNGVSNLILFKDYEDIILAAKENKVKIFTVDEPCAIFYLNKYNILENFKIGFNLYTGQFHRAVRKGDEPILSYVEEGFKLIPKKKYDELRAKWFGVAFKKQLPIKTIIIIFSIFFVFTLYLILNSYLLSRMVKKRTNELALAYSQIEKEKNFMDALFRVFPDIIIGLNNDLKEIVSFIPDSFIKNNEDIKSTLLDKFKNEWINNPKFLIDNYLLVEYEFDTLTSKIFLDIRIIQTKSNLILLLARDITEKKYIEKSIVQKQKLEVIGTLASGLAHDINNVLHSTLSVSSLIKMMLDEKDISKDNLFEYAEILEKSALKGTSLVSSLLNFSRDSTEQKSRFNLLNVIGNSINIFEMKYKKRVNANFLSELDEANFEGNENQIMQAILNLLINSFEALEKKEVEENKVLNVYLKKIENYYEIDIEDNGIGIEPEISEKIFDPFFTTKGQGRGVGVGLTIAKKIVEDHGGKISFESRMNSKTVFRVYLPIKTIKNFEINDTLNFEDNKKIELNKNTILLVDDDINVLKVTKKNLEKRGFNVIESTNPNDAMNVFEENKDKISFCIVDLVMPEINGIELLEHLIFQGFNGKKIVCTGFKDDPRLSENQSIKIDKIIEKPYKVDYLVEQIEDLMYGKADER